MTIKNIPQHVGFIGFGEAGMAFVSGWGADRPPRITAHDLKTHASGTRNDMLARFAAHDVDEATDTAGAEAVFCVVTADQALAAAEAAAPNLAPGTLWLDCNSCAPGTKRRAAAVIEAAGGRYVDAAVMAPVHPKRHHVPILLSGPHAEAAQALLAALDMRPSLAGDEVGRASSIKMLRSVMIKGLEALTAECFLAARRAGVEAEVIGSLIASDPDVDWPARGTYNLERMLVHGARRAAEMREVALTVAELGLTNTMSAGAADWQQAMADLHLDPGADDLIARLDQVLAAV